MRSEQEQVVGRAVGTAVRQARLALGWSLDDLAVKVSCGKGYLSAIERGLRPPPKAELAKRIEAALGLPAGQVAHAGSWCRADASVRTPTPPASPTPPQAQHPSIDNRPHAHTLPTPCADVRETGGMGVGVWGGWGREGGGGLVKGLIPLDTRLVRREGGPWFAVRAMGDGAWVVGEPRGGPVGELGWVVVWERTDGMPIRRDGVSARLDRVWRWAPIVGRLELV